MSGSGLLRMRSLFVLLSFALVLSILPTQVTTGSENSSLTSSTEPTSITSPDPRYAAIAKPTTFSMIPPWQVGDQRKVTFSYGGEPTHRMSQCASATDGNTQDCYALDFGGRFDVVAIADGVVRYAGWSSGGFEGYGQFVYICHGTYQTSKGQLEICSMYAHLESMSVAKDDEVQQGDRIGVSGRSTNGSLTGYSESNRHLHFALYAGGTLLVTPSKAGPHSGYAVVPEPFSECEKEDGSACQSLNVVGEQLRRTSPGIPVDLLFAIDTTGSMHDDIDQVKQRVLEILNAILEHSDDVRIAVVDFRDFRQRTGVWYDYPYRDVLGFTTDIDAAKRAILDLSLGHGGDGPETRNCALIHAIRGYDCAGYGAQTSIGSWRNIAIKSIIYMTDAPAHSPEPYTGYTNEDLIEIAGEVDIALSGNGNEYYGVEEQTSMQSVHLSSLAAGIDPLRIYPIVIGNNDETMADAEAVANGTGGRVFQTDNADGVVDVLIEAIKEAIGGELYLPMLAR